jgi:hypothetical protein
LCNNLPPEIARFSSHILRKRPRLVNRAGVSDAKPIRITPKDRLAGIASGAQMINGILKLNTKRPAP